MKLDKPNALKYSIGWENVINSCLPLHRSGHSLDKNLMQHELKGETVFVFQNEYFIKQTAY